MQKLSLKNARIWWLNLPVCYRGAAIVAIPAACWIATLGGWVWSRQSEISANYWISHTETVLSESNNLLTGLLNAETASRGYSISLDRTFLKPYQKAKTNLPIALDRLSQLVEDNPIQSRRVENLDRLVTQRLNLLEQRTILLEKKGLSAARSPLSQKFLYQGKETMDAIRVSIAALEAEEQRLLDLRRQDLKNIQNTTSILLWLTAGVSFLGYLAAMYLYRYLDSELRGSKTLVEAIIGNIVDGVITLDKNSKIETFNASATEMFGYEPAEVIGKDLEMLLSGMQTIKDRDNPLETQGHRKTGETFPIEISISKMQLDEQSLAIIRDITERQQAQAKLQARADELARLNETLAQTNLALADRNQELDRFTYVVSHDLKAPLRAIANLSEWIEEDLEESLTSDTKHQMSLLRGRVQRMNNLIDALLQYSRVGRVKSQPELIDVGQLLSEIIDSLDPPADFAIVVAQKMPTMLSERLPLIQVFSNLISNAIKHHDRTNGRIEISVEDKDQWYEFSVADDGPGIAPEYHEKVFIIFQTLEARDTKESTGIGLSIVKKIVENQGGTIYLESQLGCGTTFYFTWKK
jgi:PAS domain S-box-containing protein